MSTIKLAFEQRHATRDLLSLATREEDARNAYECRFGAIDVAQESTECSAWTKLRKKDAHTVSSDEVRTECDGLWTTQAHDKREKDYCGEEQMQAGRIEQRTDCEEWHNHDERNACER